MPSFHCFYLVHKYICTFLYLKHIIYQISESKTFYRIHLEFCKIWSSELIIARKRYAITHEDSIVVAALAEVLTAHRPAAVTNPRLGT